jgi:catechol 2,3-dioxygenase-like lactoylglutathione lyase family enzyme
VNLDGVTLFVSDLEAELRFWRDFLGCASGETWPAQQVVRAGTVDLLLDGTREHKDVRGIELRFRCERAHIEALVAAAPGLGVPVVRPAKDYGGPLGFEAALRSPAGCLVVLHAG